MQARSVPMAVPMSCVHQVSPKVNTLTCIPRVRIFNINWIEGKDLHSLLYFCRYCFMVGRPLSGLIFVCIDMASKLKSNNDGGKDGRTFSVLISSCEFLCSLVLIMLRVGIQCQKIMKQGQISCHTDY